MRRRKMMLQWRDEEQFRSLLLWINVLRTVIIPKNSLLPILRSQEEWIKNTALSPFLDTCVFATGSSSCFSSLCSLQFNIRTEFNNTFLQEQRESIESKGAAVTASFYFHLHCLHYIMIIHSGDYCRRNIPSNEKPDDFLSPPHFHITNRSKNLGKHLAGLVLP